MGIIWRSAMPLLTTLAALVIIVNSAEEDLEAEYRHDLRPRVLDTGTQNYDQPWRVMESDPPMPQSRQADNWENESPDDLPKRRRPGRKRKRRPQTVSAEEILAQEGRGYPEDPRPIFDVDYTDRQTTETVKRRRKKPENRPIRWADDFLDIERPIRRRGQRRKRPSLNSWPVLAEFRHTDDIKQENREGSREIVEPINNDNSQQDNVQADILQLFENDHVTKQTTSTLKLEPYEQVTVTEIPLALEDSDNPTEPSRYLLENKSLSEFSGEFRMAPRHRPTVQLTKGSIKNRTSEIFKNYDKTQDNIMDPPTLKDILKRSNGTSLSEILQQHNLSLTDLLRGNQQAVSIFNANESPETQNHNTYESKLELPEKQGIQNLETEELTLVNSETKYAKDIAVAAAAAADSVSREIRTEGNKTDISEEIVTTVKPVKDITPKIATRHRFPVSTRKKLRMRPVLNNTYKGQLSRDLMALNARKYSHHRRNITKSREWKDIIPSMLLNNISNDKNDTEEIETTTFAYVQEETTITIEMVNNNNTSEEIKLEEINNSKLDDIDIDPTETPDVLPPKEIQTEVPKPVTDKPTVIPKFRPPGNASGLRRQAFNNRLKRKRLKHKNTTTEPPQDDLIKHLFGLGSLVSSSEFIAKTEMPRLAEENKDLTTLEDFMTTESTRKPESHQVQNRVTKMTTVSVVPYSTTEETAKIEIEEIFNDTQTSARLSQILMERNMTLGQLVEHRERGSSHVHLADIFHNASREPNPPEPFLSKSLIEPISKETYPLRALLDANLHEPTTKATTEDSGFINNINIPVVMDFRNNVNENAENMGIMSLFNNFTKIEDNTTPETQDSKEKVNNTTADAVTVPTVTSKSETLREGRVLNENQDDIVSWNEIFSLMGRNQHNDTALNNFDELSPLKPFKKIRLDEDADGDGLIVLEDLQHLKDFDSNIASGSDEKIEVNAYENREHRGSGILDKIPSQTKSVTVATASIAGLAMILFLLTYAAFKWKQQRSAIRKKRNYADERIPTPVFENRKGHKHNSSTRSISPMLQTSNIYTLNTLDSQNGKDSPDYMWDSLRKPFQ